MLVSGDGTNWINRAIPINGTLNRITYGNGRYVAVGNGTNGGITATTPDLINWTISSPGTPDPLRAVAFGGGVFAAVSSNNYAGYLITSTNDVNWISRALPANLPITDIVYGAGRFVAALSSDDGQVLTSDDGTNWNTAVVSNGRIFTRLSFANNKFFASGYHYGGVSDFLPYPDLSFSENGIQWSSTSNSWPTELAEIQFVYGNGLFLGINGTRLDWTSVNPLSSSIDGSNFTSFAANNYLNSDSLTFGNGVFVNSSLQSSLDGTNWSPTAVSPATGIVQEMLQNATGYVAIASPMLVSSNGLEFAIMTNTIPAYLGRVRFANGLYHGAGAGGAIVRSTNGLDWELRNSATTQNLNDIEFGNSLWVAVGANGTITASTTGNAWSLRTSGTAVALNGIAFANNLFVVVGQSGTVLTSTDGNTWSAQYSGTLETLNKITFGNGQFVAVGQHGTIVTSPDAINWTARTSGTASTLTGIAFGDGVFCVAGSVVLTSVDGATWQERKVESSSLLSGVRFFNGTFFVFGSTSILQSGPVIPPQLQTGWNSGTPQIAIHASPNLLLRMESIEDLGAPQWADHGLISISSGGDFNFQDSNSVQTSRFYRAVAP